MAADNELRLLSAVVRQRDIVPLLQRGVSDDWFNNEDARTLWTFVRNHYRRYGEVPTRVTVKDNYPNARLLRVEDTIEYLLDQFIAHRARMATIDIVRDATNAVNDGNDHEAALAVMEAGLARLRDDMVGESRDVDLAATAGDFWEAYLERKNAPDGCLGIPIGFPTIDEITGGMSGGQLIVIIAPPKTGKTTLMVQIGANIHAGDLVPFVTSFEMGVNELTSRHHAARAHVSHTRMQRGQLRPEEERRLKSTLDTLGGQHRFILGDGASANTLTALQAQVIKYDPDVVMVDGVYLMTDEVTGEMNTSQALTNLTRGLKRFAQKIDKPVIISTQTLLWKMKKNKVTADSIGYSSSFFQDADLILGLQKPVEDEDGDDLDDSERTLKIVASRNSGPGEVELLWDWNNGHFREAPNGGGGWAGARSGLDD